MAYYFNQGVSDEDYQKARLIELNVVKAVYRRHLKEPRSFQMVSEWGIKRRVEDPDDSLRVWEGVDYIHILWLKFDAPNWLRSEDCPDWDGILWIRVMERFYNKLTMNTFNMILEKEIFKDNLGDTHD